MPNRFCFQVQHLCSGTRRMYIIFLGLSLAKIKWRVDLSVFKVDLRMQGSNLRLLKSTAMGQTLTSWKKATFFVVVFSHPIGQICIVWWSHVHWSMLLIPTVDGCEILDQLIGGKHPIIYRVSMFQPSKVVQDILYFFHPQYDMTFQAIVFF